MKHPRFRAVYSAPLLFALAWACSEPPQPVDLRMAPRAEGLAGSRPADGGGGAHGGIHGGDYGAEEAEQGPLTFGGVALLHGALGQDREGALFISLRPEAGGMPVLSHKLELGDARLEPAVDGVRRVPFLIDDRHTMMAGMPTAGRFQLEVRYDPDGIVDTRDGIVVERVPARRGSMDHRVELRPPAY